MILPPDGIHELPAEEYHSHFAAASKGMLSDFIDDRRKFEARYITRSIPPKSFGTTKQKRLDVGTTCHAAFLEPETAADLIAIIPEEHLTSDGKAGVTKTYKAWNIRDLCPIKLKAADYERAAKIIDALLDRWGDLLTGPAEQRRTEASIYFTVEAGTVERRPIRCRIRPDLLLFETGRIIGGDLKISEDNRTGAFRSIAKSLKYWLTDAHYRIGISAATNLSLEAVDYWFLTCRDAEPFVCRAYEMAEETREKAFDVWAQTLDDYADCLTTGDWSEPGERELMPIRLFDRDFGPSFFKSK